MKIGWALIAAGLAMLGAVLFVENAGFTAPRGIVVMVGMLFVLAGILAVRKPSDETETPAADPVANACGAAIFLLFGAIPIWMLVALDPESGRVSTNLPLDFLPDGIRGFIDNLLFHGVLGIVAVTFVGVGMAIWKRVLQEAGAWAFVATAVAVAVPIAWAGQEWYAESRLPAEPVMRLSFDENFPGNGLPTHIHGSEVAQRPGRVGQALFVGGNGDWLEVEAPFEARFKRSLTLEFWMNRENWINPYRKGSASQNVVSLEFDKQPGWFARLYLRPHPAIDHINFSLRLSVPREYARESSAEPVPEHYHFRPSGDVGDIRLRPRKITIGAQRWVHVAIVYDRLWFDRVRLYVDGALAARAVPQGRAPEFGALRKLHIGTWHERSGAFRGSVDEMKLFGRALSEAEIAASAARGTPSAPSGLASEIPGTQR